MKKIFLIAILSLCTIGLNAQALMTGSPATVTNTTPVSVTKEVTGVAKNVSVQLVVSKTSGTIAGKAYVQVSLNGTDYVSIDSMTLTDITTNTQVTELPDNPYRFYRIQVVGSGTMAGVLNGYIVANSFGGSSTVQALKSTSNIALDTVTNGATEVMTAQKLTLPYKTISISATVTKTSGTIAGTITLQGSVNGSNYVTVPTAFIETPSGQAPYSTGGAATFTPTNVASQTKIWTVIGTTYPYYRISYTGSGTMVGTIKGNIFVTQ